MSEWGGAEQGLLQSLANIGFSAAEVALVLKRTRDSVTSRAGRQSVSFVSADHRPLRKHLKAGGWLVREDCGGAVGVRWSTASRNGVSFSAPLCDAMAEHGLLILDRDGRAYGASIAIKEAA